MPNVGDFEVHAKSGAESLDLAPQDVDWEVVDLTALDLDDVPASPETDMS